MAASKRRTTPKPTPAPLFRPTTPARLLAEVRSIIGVLEHQFARLRDMERSLMVTTERWEKNNEQLRTKKGSV
jgi:hypothetical protein